MPHSTLDEKVALEGQRVEVVSLETVDYGRLAAKDSIEIEKLLSACQMPGFFQLDLDGESSGRFLPGLKEMYALSKEYFDIYLAQDVEGKDVTKPEEKMGSFEVPHQKLIDQAFKFPRPLNSHVEFVETFIWLCHSINKTMLSCLSDALYLEGTDRFEHSNADNKPGETAFNLIHAPTKSKRADCPDTTHTDNGTLTLLCCDDWGIMLEHPETKKWAFCEPKPGCALINVGDALQKLSGNRLHSCRHAVTQPVDGFRRRFYVVSYLRPGGTS